MDRAGGVRIRSVFRRMTKNPDFLLKNPVFSIEESWFPIEQCWFYNKNRETDPDDNGDTRWRQ